MFSKNSLLKDFVKDPIRVGGLMGGKTSLLYILGLGDGDNAIVLFK